jgi:predicted glycosyltransferase
MRVWMDFSASAHPIVLRPVVERLRARGHEVEMTARDYAQTLDICRIQGLDAVQIGEHGGAGRISKLRSLATRTRAMKRFGRNRGFDLAIGHGSNDLALAARSLRIPAVNTFDYEWATLQHNIGCRCARRVLVPDTIPP